MECKLCSSTLKQQIARYARRWKRARQRRSTDLILSFVRESLISGVLFRRKIRNCREAMVGLQKRVRGYLVVKHARVDALETLWAREEARLYMAIKRRADAWRAAAASGQTSRLLLAEGARVGDGDDDGEASGCGGGGGGGGGGGVSLKPDDHACLFTIAPARRRRFLADILLDARLRYSKVPHDDAAHKDSGP